MKSNRLVQARAPHWSLCGFTPSAIRSPTSTRLSAGSPDLGIERIEPFALLDWTEQLADTLSGAGLSVSADHSAFLSDEIEHQGRRVPLPPRPVIFETAQPMDVELLIDPIVPADRWRSLDAARRTADRFNEAAQEATARRIRWEYHNLSFEFHHTIEGVNACEHFGSLLEPGRVVEADLFRAATAGQNVPGLLHRLADPFRQRGGYLPEQLRQQALGEGELQIEETLAAAPVTATSGIEFDHVPGDPFRAIE